jgi:feruloyl-CoA synthase
MTGTNRTETRTTGGVAMLAPRVSIEETPDGSLILRSDHELGDFEDSLGEMLLRTAERVPDEVFMAERDEISNGWRQVTYGQTLEWARSIGQSLLEMGLSPDRPLMVLSGNSVNHGLLMVACYFSGIPIAPVSVAYSLQSKTFDRLSKIKANLGAGALYVEIPEAFENAIQAAGLDDLPIIVGSGAGPSGTESVTFDELLDTRPATELDTAISLITPDTIAKILYTSGSTGSPKGVINTHRMLCANQQSLAQIWPFTQETPPVLLDWLPWSHTFGGNHNFNLVLKQGGTMYIDAGRPAPGLIEQTVANLREVSPTISFNVPAGYGALLPFLESDQDLAERFFSRLQVIFYAAASLPQGHWDRLQALARVHGGEDLTMTTSWGSTETAPAATSAHFPLDRASTIGVPLPGVEIKLVPGTKTEVRVRGPNVTPGYWNEPSLTEAAFDDDRFYRIGDAVRLVDENDPSRGLVFDGRIAEDFKLTTGTWVNVGQLRVDSLHAAAGLIQDAVVCAPDRDYVTLLAWLNAAEAEKLTGTSDLSEASRSDVLRQALRERFDAHNSENPGTSRRIKRLRVIADPPHVDAGEITDKGYINQGRVLERRGSLVDSLYADEPSPEVIEIF